MHAVAIKIGVDKKVGVGWLLVRRDWSDTVQTLRIETCAYA